jgi:hypothetical protein
MNKCVTHEKYLLGLPGFRCGSLRAFAVVAWDLGGETQVGTVQRAGVELFEEAVEEEAGEDRREGSS